MNLNRLSEATNQRSLLVAWAVLAWFSCAVVLASDLAALPPAAEPRPEVGKCWQQELGDLEDALAKRVPQKRPEPEGDRMLDAHAVLWDRDRDTVDVVLRRTRALLQDQKSMPDSRDLTKWELALEEIAGDAGRLPVSATISPGRMALYARLCALRRQIALANPLLDFDELLFVSRKNAHKGIIQGNNAYAPAPGGGLYVASSIKSGAPAFRNLLENSQVRNGSLKGRTLHDEKGRSFQGLDLSYDGQQVVFAYADVRQRVQLPHLYNGLPCAFNIFRVGVDGTGLTQLTEGIWKNHSPCWLPNGRIVFCSERRQLTNRCSGLRDYESAATLYSMQADGSDSFPISWHEVDEINPSVDNDGKLVYTRWDYVDRDFNAAHHFWQCGPDGTNPRAPHGNYPQPYHTLNGRWDDGRAKRPWAEQSIRAIPGASGKFVAVATGHHLPPHGPLVLLDISVPDDSRLSQVRIVTGDGSLPLDDAYRGGTPYVCPWPLSAAYYLAAESETRKVFLLDKFGNRELLFEAPGDLPLFQVLPLRARPAPPVLPTRTYQGVRAGSPEHKRATIGVANVYESDLPWPPGTQIKALRIVEVFPRAWAFPIADSPRIGYGTGSNARMALGTVPVEADGSAYFEAPVGKAVYFQALDENGMAVQSMRSCTYVHPGEQMMCLGCHESKSKAPPPRRESPLAMRRAPSKLAPEPDGSLPFSFARLAQPVLEAKCVGCHQQKNVQPDFAPAKASPGDAPAPVYAAMERYAFYFHGQGAALGLQRLHGGYRTIPGRFGTRQSSLLPFLAHEHHGVELTREERRRLTVWLDLNSNELGAYRDADRQRRGEIVWPDGVDPSNPTGVETDRPIP